MTLSSEIVSSVLPPESPGFQLTAQVEELKQMLLAKHPRMPVLLNEIYTTLRAQPENVTLATEEQIQTIVNGLKIVTMTEFAAATVKTSKTASVTAKLKNITLDGI